MTSARFRRFRPRLVLPLLVVVVAAALSGCQAFSSNAPSVLDPRGQRAAPDSNFGWFMFALAAVIFAIVVLLVLIAIARRRGGSADLLRRGERPASDRQGHIFIIGFGLVFPIVTLTVLVVLTLQTLVALSAPAPPGAMTVQIVGHQFWWEVRYPGANVVTANEIHIPTGQRVAVEVTTQDVIHSFWVPQIMPKVDMIPGQTNVSWIEADQPGTYRGQCAEFCGVQHAHMALLVFADPPDQFNTWLQNQAQPAVRSSDPVAQQGAQVFASAGCITCHAIRVGAQPTGRSIGPDLTHLASRTTLAADLMPNNRGDLQGWVSNPQALKPGNLMPVLNLDATSLNELVTYLQSLS